MWPVLLEIGPVKLYSYGFMIAVGFLIATHFAQKYAAEKGFSPKVFSDMAFGILVVGFLGTRLTHILMFPGQYSTDDLMGYIAVWRRGGLVFQGAILPALLFVIWYLRRHRVPFWKACDVMFPYFPLAHAFGRIGCFLYGCCYGRPTEVLWAIPARRVPGVGGQVGRGRWGDREEL